MPSAAPEDTPRSFTLIRYGDRSDEVADVQARLRGLGFTIADDPGVFGPSTRAAVRAFQQQRGILVDGIVGPNTWSELVEASWRLGQRQLYLKRPYMRGDDVLELQARLNALGYDAGREDGIFGPDTDQAVRAFQREYDVAEDGIFGPRTHAALAGLRVDRPSTSAPLREELRRTARGGVAGALVVIDPGHGGEDEGERGCDGLVEADLCWDLAQRVADRVARSGAQVRFTRTESEGPDVPTRAARANDAGADVFVSLHLNAHPDPRAEGSSAYHFRTSRSGERLADAIQNRLVALGLKDCRCHPRSYPILRETRMPAVLLEPGFITSHRDAPRLASPDFRSDIADAVASGLRRYFED